MKGNREYKSDVFSMLMEDPRNALDLYNALNGSHYADPELVEITTLERGISLSVCNDASFILDMSLNIYEHQSTVCPNMPLRDLKYFSNTLDQMLVNRDLFGRRLVKIPTPHFAVFYNGEEEQPETYEMKLSDAFEKPTDRPEVELVCTVYNINRGKNRELLDRCSFLKEYMIFVDCVRDTYRENNSKDLKGCIESAIDYCIEENVLRDFLTEKRSEVVKMTELDYTFERRIQLERQESLAEGRAAGLSEGRAAGLSEGFAAGELRRSVHILRKKVQKQKSLEQTAMEMEERPEDIKLLYDVAKSCAPDYDEEQICRAYLEQTGQKQEGSGEI